MAACRNVDSVVREAAVVIGGVLWSSGSQEETQMNIEDDELQNTW